jgi:DNA-binding response OmpR family regulator
VTRILVVDDELQIARALALNLRARQYEVAVAADGSEALRRAVDWHLTPIQWRLVEILLRNPGKLISQRWLLTEVWGASSDRKTHYLRQYMAQLRRKLEVDPAHPRHLLTEPGMG